jgi:hypothetical protein
LPLLPEPISLNLEPSSLKYSVSAILAGLHESALERVALDVIREQTSDNATTMALLREVANLMHTSGLPDTQLLPAAATFLGQTVVNQASNAAFQDGFVVVCGIFLLALNSDLADVARGVFDRIAGISPL